MRWVEFTVLLFLFDVVICVLDSRYAEGLGNTTTVIYNFVIIVLQFKYSKHNNYYKEIFTNGILQHKIFTVPLCKGFVNLLIINRDY